MYRRNHYLLTNRPKQILQLGLTSVRWFLLYSLQLYRKGVYSDFSLEQRQLPCTMKALGTDTFIFQSHHSPDSCLLPTLKAAEIVGYVWTKEGFHSSQQTATIYVFLLMLSFHVSKFRCFVQSDNDIRTNGGQGSMLLFSNYPFLCNYYFADRVSIQRYFERLRLVQYDLTFSRPWRLALLVIQWFSGMRL